MLPAKASQFSQPVVRKQLFEQGRIAAVNTYGAILKLNYFVEKTKQAIAKKLVLTPTPSASTHPNSLFGDYKTPAALGNQQQTLTSHLSLTYLTCD